MLNGIYNLPFIKEFIAVFIISTCLGIAGAMDKVDAEMMANYEQTLGE